MWHTGTVPGYFSAVYLDAESGDGAVVLLGVAALVLMLGWLGRRRLRPVAWILLAVVVVAAALIAAPLLMGVPLRYFWLWEPGVVLAAAAVPVAMLLAAAMAAGSRGRGRGRQTQSPSPVPRPQMG
ncbi:MAG TPA: hypothetical protein GXZ46_06660 [Actinomycetales bacterium]|nr:hypothetical protein [Actinomycetales bacterium]